MSETIISIKKTYLVLSNMFYFHPTWKMIQFDEDIFFSNGLVQPPTSYRLVRLVHSSRQKNPTLLRLFFFWDSNISASILSHETHGFSNQGNFPYFFCPELPQFCVFFLHVLRGAKTTNEVRLTGTNSAILTTGSNVATFRKKF